MDNPEATYKLAHNTFHSGGSPGYVRVDWVEIFSLFPLSIHSLFFLSQAHTRSILGWRCLKGETVTNGISFYQSLITNY